jgi:hypothetical protein
VLAAEINGSDSFFFFLAGSFSLCSKIEDNCSFWIAVEGLNP